MFRKFSKTPESTPATQATDPLVEKLEDRFNRDRLTRIALTAAVAGLAVGAGVATKYLKEKRISVASTTEIKIGDTITIEEQLAEPDTDGNQLMRRIDITPEAKNGVESIDFMRSPNNEETLLIGTAISSQDVHLHPGIVRTVISTATNFIDTLRTKGLPTDATKSMGMMAIHAWRAHATHNQAQHNTPTIE